MWSKRKEEDTVLKPVQPAYIPVVSESPGREPIMSSPIRTFDAEPAPRSGGAATLGKNVTVKGQIFSREDLVVDGEVEGTIECQEHKLTIGPNAKVQAGLRARDIVIFGSIQGNVEALDKIDIKKEAKLVGDIKTSRIMIEDGAYFKGSIDITKGTAAPARTVASPVTAGAPAAPITPGSATTTSTPAAASQHSSVASAGIVK
jgi:cytoskeletal protein CcmA (bactofilin family)